MAERVEIEIPGIGKIEAKNAASEATLLEILRVLEGTRKDTQKTNKELKEGLKGLGDKGGPADPFAKLSSNAQNFGKHLGTAAKHFGGLVGTVQLVANKFNSLTISTSGIISEFSNLGDSVAAAAQTFNKIPLLGPALGAAFGAVVEATERQVKAYQQLTSIGASFGGDLTAMTAAASGAGLTIEQFSSLIAKNGEALALLGGTAELGAKRFAEAGRAMRNSGLTSELMRMGYTTEQINEGMAGYIKNLARGGQVQNLSTAELVAGSAKYLKELDALAKVTGKNREDLEKERDRLMKDAQFKVAMAKVDAESRERAMRTIQLLPESLQEGAKDMIASGSVTTEAAARLHAMYPELSKNLRAMGQSAKNTGKISEESARKTYRDAVQEGKANVDRFKQFATLNTEYKDLVGGAADLATKSGREYEEALEAQKKAAANAPIVEAFGKLKQRIAETSNSFNEYLVQTGLLERFGDVFETLVAFVKTIAVPVFNVLAGALNVMIPIISDHVVPVLQMLGDWITIGVIPIFERIGKILNNVFGPALSATGSIFENVLEPALFAITDFISAVLEPALVLFAGVLTVKFGAMALAAAQATVSMIAMALPFIKVIAVVGAVVLAVKGLIYIFNNFGKIMSTIGDGIKIWWNEYKNVFNYLKLGIFKIIDLIPGISMKDEIKGVEADIANNRAETQKAMNNIAENWKKNESEKDKRQQARERREEEANKRKLAREQDQRDKEAKRNSELDRKKDNLLTREEELARAAEGTAEEQAEAVSKLYGGFYHKKSEPATPKQEPTRGAAGAEAPKGESTAFKGNQKEFYDKMYKTLLESAKKQGIENPEAIAHLGASQSALETGYGKHLAGGNNYFGIKARPGEGGPSVATKEFINGRMVTINDRFRKYGSMEESADDYIRFLKENKRYKNVLAAKTAEEAIEAQGRTGYATDPNYALKLRTIYKKGDVTVRQGAAIKDEPKREPKKAEAAQPKESWWKQNMPSWLGGKEEAKKKEEPKTEPAKPKLKELTGAEKIAELEARREKLLQKGPATDSAQSQNAHKMIVGMLDSAIAEEKKKLVKKEEPKAEPAKPKAEEGKTTYMVGGKLATKEQYDAEKAKFDALKKEIDQRGKLSDKLGLAAGPGVNPDGTANDAMKAFMDNQFKMNNLFNQLGEMPKLEETRSQSLFENISGMFGNLVPSISDNFNKLMPNISGMFGNLMPSISDGFGKLMPNISGMFGNLMPGIKGIFEKSTPDPKKSTDTLDALKKEFDQRAKLQQKLALGAGSGVNPDGTANDAMKAFMDNESKMRVFSDKINAQQKSKSEDSFIKQGLERLYSFNSKDLQAITTIKSQQPTLADSSKNQLVNQTSEQLSQIGMQMGELVNKTNVPVTPTVQPTEMSPSLLESLNTKLDRMIAVNERLLSINDDQLRVQRGIGTNDVYSMT